jgi:hypothetical protein
MVLMVQDCDRSSPNRLIRFFSLQEKRLTRPAHRSFMALWKVESVQLTKFCQSLTKQLKSFALFAQKRSDMFHH